MKDIKIPTIYFWIDLYNDKPEIMTAAFKWRGMCYGHSYPLEKGKLAFIRRKADKAKLIEFVKEALDVTVHHGVEVLDKDGNINPTKVNNAEAERFWLDQNWRSEVIALRRAMLVKEITGDQALELGLL